jgi:hypothetical protein
VIQKALKPSENIEVYFSVSFGLTSLQDEIDPSMNASKISIYEKVLGMRVTEIHFSNDKDFMEALNCCTTLIYSSWGA